MGQLQDPTPEIEKRIKQDLRDACDRLRDDLRGYRVVLFGSRAAGSARERSDFDVGILGPAPLPFKTFYQLEDLFDEIETLHRIDLVDLNRVSSGFRREALKKTEALYG